ncbi:hypothetical protein MKW92_024169 [Papaver armeniacum]|nr:hypothetical protein MKW92_024169 [Papaver armeniacum]
MVNYLPQIFSNGLIEIIDLKLIPYGNAKITSDKVITWQHGPTECVLNTVEACALQVWPAQDKHFNFINCVETFVYNAELGYAKTTGALNPPHKYVPWVTVNDVPLFDDYRNFQTYVCNAYQGSRPTACQAQQMGITSKTKSDQILEVTFMDETFHKTNIRSPLTKGMRQLKF